MFEISVIMSVYNEPIDFLKKSIGSILDQSIKTFEFIIVVDNPQNVEAIDYLKNISDKRVKLLINEYNLGLPKSLNRAIKHSKGDYLARMDADDIAFPDRLEKQLQFLKNNHLDLCASYLVTIDESDNVLNREKIYELSSRSISELLRFRSPLPHPTWLAKRNLFIELDGYRNFHSCEDYDFLLRAKYKNKKFGLVPEYLLYYRQNSNSISNSNSYKQFLTANILKKSKEKIFFFDKDKLEKELSRKNLIAKEKKFNNAKQFLRLASQNRGINKLKYILYSLFLSPEIAELYYVSLVTFYIRNLKEKVNKLWNL